MKLLLSLVDVRDTDHALVGDKARSLALLSERGIPVPSGVCITTAAYRRYLELTSLRANIQMELGRKNFSEMRWEEVWDTSLRIRNLFLRTPLPGELVAALGEGIASRFEEKPVVVRSSAPGEDSSGASFAGLHSSFVNVTGVESVLKHVLLVWSSLFSDAALLYRRELGIDVEESTMAVLVQELVLGQTSGVAFGVSPAKEEESVVEAVHGLNQGLVDGTIEPDRWTLERATGEIIAHTPAVREKYVAPAGEGTGTVPLPPEMAARPPLTPEQVASLHECVREMGRIFGAPQDVEWTFRDGALTVLQSRPITAGTGARNDDERLWSLSLRRSFDNLQALRRRIEEIHISGMREEAEALRRMDLQKLPDGALEEERSRRMRVYEKWKKVYWDDFIPFAHGFRLFGQFYNDALSPEDPYEFIELLSGADFLSVSRNAMLEEMASLLRDDEALSRRVKDRDYSDTAFRTLLTRYVETYGVVSCTGSDCMNAEDAVAGIVLEMASSGGAGRHRVKRGAEELRKRFLSSFSPEDRDFAQELLELGRASYRLRDNDNMYLGAIRLEALRAEEEARRRARGTGKKATTNGEESARIDSLVEAANASRKRPTAGESRSVKARQVVGQRAGPGIAWGRARVIERADDLFGFRSGEVLVCDSVDPNMTFVVPLAAGIVERRGGMLVHGAIIAREYGIPCVTGVPDATVLIQTGDPVTVDGYLGIVTIG
jgi:pyruvate,water dikinase